MTKLKSAFAGACARLGAIWHTHGNAALLAFVIAFAMVIALDARR